ncbi:hypothetical protein M378DRAFT_172804 [Amanita muscaria Koide BX008]|uniref:Uncharacterized protein n=1 Tax=Amanita muscaria (strain Koide BX008) TaxID=946122 RepID=A0A0C2WJM8_AMAMK|nr:hypothetical protein M378DRAFT_172804 [Amanita muscaria Koide BX008]
MKRLQAFAISNAEQKLKFLVEKVLHIIDDVGKRSAIGSGGDTIIFIVPALSTAKKHLVAFSARLYETTRSNIPFALILSISTFATTSSKPESQHSLMNICPIFFIRIAPGPPRAETIFPPVSHSRTPSLAADALATVKIFVDTRLVKWTNF